MERSPVKFARTTEGYVAYQTSGDGPIDILFVPDWGSCLDALWDLPSSVRLLQRLASIGRLILFDKRGHGISDPLPNRHTPIMEAAVEDCLTVMEACGSRQAVVVGNGHAGAVGVLFAASHPERTKALVLHNSFARFLRDADYPIGLPTESTPTLLGQMERTFGTGEAMALVAPSLMGDKPTVEWFGRLQRLAMGPSQATVGMGRFLLMCDVRSFLSSVSVPTLVTHRKGSLYARFAHAEYLAAHIPGAELAALSGDEFISYLGDTEELAKRIEEFVVGVRETGPRDRILATVLFSDIVDSTRRAASAGDRAWRGMLDRHDAITADQIARNRGRLIKSTGDGVLATFDGPARAISCARGMRDGLREIDLEIRAGVHAGEVEIRGNDVGGITVHIAARVASGAGPGEILVSKTVADLVVGSDIGLDDRGEHELKGVPGMWRLLAVADS